jgi:hypothetical protein
MKRFLTLYHEPILIENVPLETWNEQSFLGKYGGCKTEMADHTTIPPQRTGRQIRLSQAMSTMKEGGKVCYVDNFSLKQIPDMKSELDKAMSGVPFLKSNGPLDMLRYLNEDLFPEEKVVAYDNLYLYVGNSGTTTPLHIDTLSTSAMNVVWTGCKHWWFVLCRDEAKVLC